jgi:hypothetical protein
MTTVASLMAKFEGDTSGLMKSGQQAEAILNSVNKTVGSVSQNSAQVKFGTGDFVRSAETANQSVTRVGASVQHLREQSQNLNFNADGFTRFGQTATGAITSVNQSLTTTIQQIAAMSLGLVGLQAVLGGVGGILGAFQSATFGMNATLETSTQQFSILMGNADAAKKHVADLFEIAKETPFETAPIIAASRTLQTFGGAALNTHDNIILMGDAAAGANTSISEVAFWVGRAYSMIQGGQPFGEAAMRLQELAILTPKARQEMEALQKAGGDVNKIWAIMTTELARFQGSMKLQAGTWQGVTSTFEDTKNILISKVFQPLFESARDNLGRLNEFLSTDAVETWAQEMQANVIVAIKALGILGDTFATVFGSIANTVLTLGRIIYQGLQLINPFARHSPPLVDQVEEGLDLILAKYEELRTIEEPLRAVGECRQGV